MQNINAKQDMNTKLVFRINALFFHFDQTYTEYCSYKKNDPNKANSILNYLMGILKSIQFFYIEEFGEEINQEFLKRCDLFKEELNNR